MDVDAEVACIADDAHEVGTAARTAAAFLLGVIVIVSGLIYFPTLILGPIGERIVG
ncbi:MAG TPA: potassium-transporting ATPase subunit KdpA [Streptosporangiaceae bacterium]|nr:potassium-transporting ATPase subunit KdpA [Streptosporangiaceae bacterium]